MIKENKQIFNMILKLQIHMNKLKIIIFKNSNNLKNKIKKIKKIFILLIKSKSKKLNYKSIKN